MKKLFENVGSNKFKILTESNQSKIEMVESGLRKVFSNSDKEISYHRIQTVGLGYINGVTEAQQISLKTARRLCESFGYKDDEYNAKFVKETDTPGEGYDSPFSDEFDMSKSEEKREVQIGKEIVRIVDGAYEHVLDDELLNKDFDAIQKLANELIKMHGQ